MCIKKKIKNYMHETFNLALIMERFGLDEEAVQQALFPHNRYKKAALDRVLKGETYLETCQVEALAKLAGALIQDLFTIDKNWKGSSNQEALFFKKGEYTARLTYRGTILTVLKGSQVIKQELLCTMTVSDFIKHLEDIIS